MPETKIDKFFSPVNRTTKRLRPYSSPESENGEDRTADNMDGGGDEKVGDITRSQLLNDLANLLDSKLVNMATKEEFAQLTGQVAKLQEENVALREQVMNLQEREKLVLNRLVDLEGRSRRNNLIFRGLKWSKTTRDFPDLVRRFCNEMFGSADSIFINRAHPLGGGSDAIIAHIPNDTDIYYIMSRVSGLRGTGYAVHRDYPKEVRGKRACLSKLRAEIERVAGKQRSTLYFDHLTVKGHRFTWDEGRLLAGQEDGVKVLKTLFRHDFSKFLETLRHPKETTATGEGTSTQPSYAEVVTTEPPAPPAPVSQQPGGAANRG
jgi:hypothetical protein